jgi:DNA-binding XRE family transcriptional regulator
VPVLVGSGTLVVTVIEASSSVAEALTVFAWRLTVGAVSLAAHAILQIFTNIYKYGRIFTVDYGTVEVNVDTLKELRINAGLSQRELATRAGLTPGAVWQVENRGSGSPATLKKLADVLGVRPVALLKEGR